MIVFFFVYFCNEFQMNHNHKEKALLQLQMLSFKKGTYLLVEGKPDNYFFFIIQQGNIQYSKITENGNSTLKYGPGDFLGVVPCMAGKPQMASAIAITDVIVISVRREQYPELIANNTPVALKIIKNFSNRMRMMNELLSKAALNSVAKENYEQIFNVAYFYEKKGKNDISAFAYYQFLKTKPIGKAAEYAKRKFIALKPTTKAVYFEPTAELTRKYPQDTMVFSESQNGAEMFIIQSGEIEISKVVQGNEVTLAVLKKGDMFGEMALLENKPRSASAIARTDCVLMVINRSNFNQMVSTQPQLIFKLTMTFAERIWSMYRQLENANLSDPVAKMIDMLSLQLEKQKVELNSRSLQTDFTPKDLVNMCALTETIAPRAIYDFQEYQNIKIFKGKIFIKDVQDLFKQAAFYRKQNVQK